MRELYTKVVSMSGTYAAGNIAQNILSLILLPLYARYLTSKEFGVIALIEVTVKFVTTLISSPIDIGFSRYYYKPGYREKNGVLVFNLFLLLTVSALFFCGLYLHLSKSICRLLFNNPEYVYIIKIYAVILVITPLSSFLLSLAVLNERAKYLIFLSLSRLIISFVLTIYFLVKLKLGILSVVYGNIIALFSILLMCIPLFLRYSKFKLEPSIVKEPLQFGCPQILNSQANFLIQSGDRYVLRIFNSLDTVGVYSFGYKIAGLVNILLIDPIKNSLLPAVLHKEDDPKGQKEFLSLSATHYYFVGVFMALCLSLFAKGLTALLAKGSGLSQGWVIVPVISLSYIQHGLGNFVGWGLTMRNKPYHTTFSLLVSAAVNIGLNFIFIPLWGILGAAFATLVSYFVWNGLKIYYSAKFYSLYFDLKRLGYITIVGSGLYFLSLAVPDAGSYFLNIGIKFLLLFIYPLIFFGTRFFTAEENSYIEKLWKR